MDFSTSGSMEYDGSTPDYDFNCVFQRSSKPGELRWRGEGEEWMFWRVRAGRGWGVVVSSSGSVCVWMWGVVAGGRREDGFKGVY